MSFLPSFRGTAGSILLNWADEFDAVGSKKALWVRGARTVATATTATGIAAATTATVRQAQQTDRQWVPGLFCGLVSWEGDGRERGRRCRVGASPRVAKRNASFARDVFAKA